MSEVICRVEKRAGRITLNRPKALNALTHEMCLAMEQALESWRNDPAVALVIIDGVGEKAFCAGGDIAELYKAGRQGDWESGRKFWTDEYRLNAKLSEYNKPIVSLLHGFVMGGGVGVGCHVSHRIVGESTRMAMPECKIGLIPDVGATSVLAAAPGSIGRYLALTGARMDAADAIHAGFADHFMAVENWDELTNALVESGDVEQISSFATSAGSSSLAERQVLIDRVFGQVTLPDILATLESDSELKARINVAALDGSSPLALSAAFAILDAYREGGIREALKLEYRYTYRSLEYSDFLEGVRAVIIDKDGSPQWAHSSVDAVSQDQVSTLLAPLGIHELNLAAN